MISRIERSLLVAATLVAACGRWGYDPVEPPSPPDVGDDEDAGTDRRDAGPGVSPHCDQPFTRPRRVDDLNVAGVDDWAPWLSPDGRSLYMASFRPGGNGNSDLYVAHRDAPDGHFDAPEPLAGVNSSAYESAPAFAPDGRIFFVRLELGAGPPQFDVWTAVPDGAGGFEEPRIGLGLSLPTFDETDIDLSPDGLTAYVATERPGGAGGRDLWRAQRGGLNQMFTSIAPITELNSAKDESSMSLTSDGLEIVFASNRSGGHGALDLWLATRDSLDEPFGAPVNLDELNSNQDDSRPALSHDGLVLYYNYAASEEGGGAADIWVATRCLP